MTHLLTLFIGCLIILCTKRLYYRNFELFLCMLIPINFDFFHLVPRIGQFDIYKESLLVVVIYYFFEEFIARAFLHKKQKENFKLDIYGKLIIVYCLIVCFGFIVSIMRGQEVLYGLKAMKFFPLLLIFFIVLKKGVNVEKFFCYFNWMATTIAVLVVLQYVTYEKIALFYFYEDSVSHVRGFDSIRGMRILEGSIVITIGCIAAFASWVKRREKISLLLALFLLAELFIVAKTRSILVAVLLTMIINSFIYNRRKINNLVRMCYLTGSIICLGVIIVSYIHPRWSNNALFAETLSDLQSFTTGPDAGALNVRIKCYDYYWNELKPLWLTGRGLLNYNWAGNTDNYLLEYLHLHLSDIGVLHVLINYGFMGGFFLLLILGSIVKDIPNLISTPQTTSYFIIGIILLPHIDMFFRFDHIFLFSIFLAFFAQEKNLIIELSKSSNLTSTLKQRQVYN